MLLVSGGLEVGGGLIGRLLAQGDYDEARRLASMAMDQYGNLDVPKLEALSRTELSNVQADPVYAEAQRDVMSQLGEMAKDGFTAADEAALNRITNQTNQQARGRRGAIAQSMAQRGMSGSGTELAMLLDSEQDSANRAQQQGLDVAAQAQQRIYDAIMGRGRAASQFRQQDYGEKAKAAEAQDYINRYNNNLPQQDYQNRLGLANAKAGAYGQAAANANNRGAGTQSTWGGIAHAAGTGTRAAAMYGAPPSRTNTYRPEDYDEDGLLKAWEF